MIKERLNWVDATKAIAIILVVLTHSHEKAGVSDLLTRSVLYSIDRLGVPIFFMMSGAFILKIAAKEDCLLFYKKRIIKFIGALIICSIGTNFVYSYFIENYGLIDSFCKAIYKNGIYLGDYDKAVQLWYMYPLILLYLISPFLSKMLNALNNKEIIIFLIICIMFNQLKYTLSLYYDVSLLNRFGGDFTGAYLVYFILGYFLLNRININLLINNKILFISVISLILTIVSCYYIDKEENKLVRIIHWYSSSLHILIGGVSLFIICLNIFNRVNISILNSIGKSSYYTYLLHFGIIYITMHFIDKSISWEIKTAIFLAVSMIISHLTYLVIHKLKKSYL